MDPYIILHVEDESSIRRLVKVICAKQFGDQVVVLDATSCNTAMNALRNYPPEDRLHLIITDYHLLGRETGGDLLEAMKGDRRWCATPSILMSSEMLGDICAKHRLIAKSQPYLRKPCSMNNVVWLIRKMLKIPDQQP